jgi:hypothetical protein
MIDDLIYKTADLMEEQVRDYIKLDAACQRLADILIRGDAAAVEATTRVGEIALLQMRARLVRIIQSLTAFAHARSQAPEGNPLTPEARARFESASNNLLLAAKEFQRTRARAAALTTSGSTFATACIEMCGIQPTTYSGPYTRNGESRQWA